MQWKQLSILGACLLMSCSSLDAGWRAQKAGDYDEAQKQAMIALSREPRNPEVYQLVATTALSRGQYDSALKAAQFARRLDGGTPKTERLIRQISYSKKDWKSLCDAGLRLSTQPAGFDAEDETRMREGFKALQKSMSGDGYGCAAALEARGMTVDGVDKVRHNYVMQLVRSGQYRDALKLADASDNPDLNQLVAARSLFALNRKDEAVGRLQQYVGGASDTTREMRMAQAAAVCEEYRQYQVEAQLLDGTTSADNELRRIMALRRSFRQDDAANLLDARVANRKLTPAQTLMDMQTLCDAGYGDMALKTYQACNSCSSNPETVFKAADMLMSARESQAAVQMLADLGDANADNGDVQVRLFDWYRAKKYHAQALLCAERAKKAGIRNDAFDAARLETYVLTREYKTFEREAKAWIDEHDAPAVGARTTVAGIEQSRSNWKGVLEVLKPVNDAHALSGESLDLYLKALSATRNFEQLYGTLSTYRPDMKPESKADYFMDRDAETQFNQSIAPMISAGGMQKFEGELLRAKYLYSVKEDDAAGDKAIAEALEAADYSAYSYTRVVGFYRVLGLFDKALHQARAWTDRYPADPQAWELLGELHLARNEIDDAGVAFEKYQQVKSSPEAVKVIFGKFSSRNEAHAGVAWVERITRQYEQTSAQNAYIRARAQVYYDQYFVERDEALRQQYRDLALADYRRIIDAPADGRDLVGDATALTMMDANEDARRAFENAQKSGIGELSDGQRAYYVSVLAKSRRSDDEIRKVAVTAKTADEVFALTEKLDALQRGEAMDPVLEGYLGDKSTDNRIKAYHYLIRHASANGDVHQINKYNKKLESSAPDNPDVRMEIVRTTISQNMVDESVRHLRWLQMTRPDARDVLNAELTLGRRMPSHQGVQSMVAVALDDAEGVYYRLDWISQFFESYGDYERALYYGEKAYAASTVKDTTFELRLLRLYLRTGKYEGSETAAELLDNLRASVDWKPQQVVELAEVAQASGYYRQAQSWMNEAIGLSPDLPGLKVKKLEMALDSEDEGQIALGLEKAVESPMADVSDALIGRGQMRDIISAIDLYEQNGEHALALSTLIQVLPAYLQMRGIVSTRRSIEDLSLFATDYRTEAVEILAHGDLLGDAPCKSLTYASEIEDPEIWARIAVRCPDAHDTMMQSVRSLRSAMTSGRRANFDSSLYASLVQMQQHAIAVDYADEIGMTESPLMQFKRQIIAGSALDAMIGLAESPVGAADHIEVARLLAAYGYAAESADYIQQNIGAMPEGDRPNAAAIAVLLGSSDSNVRKYLPGNANLSLENVNGDTAARLYAAETLKSWMAATDSRNLAPVFYIALSCAKHSESLRSRIFNDIFAEIDRRNQKTTLLLSASDYAVTLGLNDFAQNALTRLKSMMPSSDFVYRSLSIVESRQGKSDLAWNSLQEGANCAPNLGEYWARAAELHAESPVDLRKRINVARLAIMPRQPSLYVNETALALESGDSGRATENARLAYAYGGDSVLPAIADVYESANANSALPEEFYRGSSSRALEVQARMALSRGDADLAMQHYIDAAQRAAWPVQVYGDAIESTLRLNKLPQAEQLIAKMQADYPHAYMPIVYRAVYELAQGRPDDAWQSYLNARHVVFDTEPWVDRIVSAGILYGHDDFVEKIYQAEKSVGAYDATAWLETVLDCSLNKLAKNSVVSKDDANHFIGLIERLVPAAAGIARQNYSIRNKFISLAEKADRVDWLQRLGTTSF